MTKSQHFFYNDEITLCYTTNHNGGISSGIRRMMEALFPGSPGHRTADVYNGDAFGELGDVHRAAILEGGPEPSRGLTIFALTAG
jgi:hypothetical protein